MNHRHAIAVSRDVTPRQASSASGEVRKAEVTVCAAAQERKQSAAYEVTAAEEEPELFKSDDFRIFCMKVRTAAVLGQRACPTAGFGVAAGFVSSPRDWMFSGKVHASLSPGFADAACEIFCQSFV